MIVGKVVVHLCLTLSIKELEFSVERDRVVTTLNTINQTLNVIFSVLRCLVSAKEIKPSCILSNDLVKYLLRGLLWHLVIPLLP
jgi:hypothetical protein